MNPDCIRLPDSFKGFSCAANRKKPKFERNRLLTTVILKMPVRPGAPLAQFVVRLAVSIDIEQILAIDPSALSRRTLIQNAVSGGECFVAGNNGVLLGYGLMNHDFFDRGFVRLICVDTAHRRLGVATRLFDEFEMQCKSNRIFTSTNLSNQPMQGFLVSRGYVLSGMIQDLDEGDPEMFYSKKLR
jgi:ribosomal protein S18 acetylase RimI-like enzyme